MEMVSGRCVRCGGAVDDGGKSWFIHKAEHHDLLLCLCADCSKAELTTCLVCKKAPVAPGKPLCQACHAAI